MQDMPVELCLTLLKYFYDFGGKPGNDANEIFAMFWDKEILCDLEMIHTLDNPTTWRFHYHYNIDYKPLVKIKSKLMEKVLVSEITIATALEELRIKTDSRALGVDNYAISVRKNLLTCLYHLNLVSNDGQLLEDGLNFYTVGHRYGFNSKPAVDEFTRLMLMNGQHLSLILDLDRFCRTSTFESGGPKDEAAWLRKFVEHYDNLGKIKWAKTRRKKEGQNEQLKYELIFGITLICESKKLTPHIVLTGNGSQG